MRTIIQIKNDIAEAEGYSNWDDFFNDLSKANMFMMLQKKMDAACDMFATQFKDMEFKELRNDPPAVGETVIAYSTSAKKATVFTFDGKFSVEYTHWMSSKYLPKI